MAYVDSADLASSDPGKGASMVGVEGGGTVQDAIDVRIARIAPSASDQSAAFQTLVNMAAGANRDIEIARPGTYKFADIVLPPRADGGVLKIRCAAGVLIDSSPGTDTFILDSTGIDFEGGSVTNTRHFAIAVQNLTGTTVDEFLPASATLDSPVNRLRIVDVDFVPGTVKSALVYLSDATDASHLIRKVELRELTMSGGWVVALVGCAFERVVVDDVEYANMDPSDVVSSTGLNWSPMCGGLRLGKNFASTQALCKTMVVTNIRFDTIRDNRNAANGDYNTNGVWLIGQNLTLRGVKGRYISNRKNNDNEGLYFKVAGWTADDIDLTDAGTLAGQICIKGQNIAEQAIPGSALGRNGSLWGYRITNTRSFGDTDPVYGYSLGNAFPAVAIFQDDVYVGKGEIIGCGSDDDIHGAIYTFVSLKLDNVVVEDNTFRNSIGRANIVINHNGFGGSIARNKSYGHNGSQLTANSDIVNVWVKNETAATLTALSVTDNAAQNPVATGTGSTYNVRVTALNGKGATVFMTVTGNRGTGLTFGDYFEILGTGAMNGLTHDGASYQSNVTTPVTIPVFPNQIIGPNSTKFMNGRTTFDLGSIADGETRVIGVSCPGCVFGDMVVAASMDLFVDGFDIVKQEISNLGTVRLTIQNNTGGAYDPPSTVFRASCVRNTSNG